MYDLKGYHYKVTYHIDSRNSIELFYTKEEAKSFVKVIKNMFATNIKINKVKV